MNFSATSSFLHFLLLSCPIVLELCLVKSMQHDGQSRQSKKVVRIKKKTDDIGFDVDVEANPVHRLHGLTSSSLRRRNESNGFTWKPLGGTIIGQQTFDRYGHSIAMSDGGRIIAIGSPYCNLQAGCARVFRLINDQSWTKVGSDIDGKEPGELLGFHLDISADGARLVIGVYGSSNHPRVARVYENVNDVEWAQIGADLQGNDEYDHFGSSVAMSSDGTTIAVGAADGDDQNGSNSGSVAVYSEKLGSWALVGDIIYGENTNDAFGSSISLSGDGLVLAIGAPSSTLLPGYAKVYKYKKKASGEWDWVQFSNLVNGYSSGGQFSGDLFGSRVSLSKVGAHIAVSGYNNTMVKVYEIPKDETLGLVQVGNDIPVQDSWAAISLSNDGRSLIIGDRYNNDFGEDAGRAQVFQLNGKEWEQVGFDLYSTDDTGTNVTNAEDHQFGFSVAISGDGSTVAAAALYSDLLGKTWCGHVRVFERFKIQQPTQSPTKPPRVSPTQPSAQPSNIGLVIGLCAAGIILVIASFMINHLRKKNMMKGDAHGAPELPVADAVVDNEFYISPSTTLPIAVHVCTVPSTMPPMENCN